MSESAIPLRTLLAGRVLLAFSLLLHNNPVVDLMGIGAGHLYFFLEDVYPQLEGGSRVLKTPELMCVRDLSSFSCSQLCPGWYANRLQHCCSKALFGQQEDPSQQQLQHEDPLLQQQQQQQQQQLQQQQQQQPVEQQPVEQHEE